jgi:hypothetical protein
MKRPQQMLKVLTIPSEMPVLHGVSSEAFEPSLS